LVRGDCLTVRALQQDRRVPFPGKRRRDRAAELQPVLRRQLCRIARSDKDDAVQLESIRGEQLKRLHGLSLELRSGGCALEASSGSLAKGTCDGGAGEVRADEEDGGASVGRSKLHETNLGTIGHCIASCFREQAFGPWG
jgi:hypothetical protein